MSSAGSHQRLQEQEVGCASLSQGYGPAKRKATAAMTKGSKHNPWAQRVFLRTESGTCSMPRNVTRISSSSPGGGVPNPAQSPWSSGTCTKHCMRRTEKWLNRVKSPTTKKQFSNSSQGKTSPRYLVLHKTNIHRYNQTQDVPGHLDKVEHLVRGCCKALWGQCAPLHLTMALQAQEMWLMATSTTASSRHPACFQVAPITSSIYLGEQNRLLTHSTAQGLLFSPQAFL